MNALIHAVELCREIGNSPAMSPFATRGHARQSGGPRVTTGNTMAPCVIVGEKAAAFIKSEAGFEADKEDRRQLAHQHNV
jgi:hypothetical protein